MGDQIPDLHLAVGGTEGWRRLATAFYSRVDRDPRIRHLFPGKTLHCAIEELTAFLVQLFGGPNDDTQRRWWLSLRESHRRFEIRAEERAAWMESMVAALEDTAIEEPVRVALREFFERASAHVVNRGPVPAAPEPSGETARRWAVQCELDEVVAAIRAGEAGRAIALASRLELRRSVLSGLLGMMMGSGDAALLAYVRDQAGSDPPLVRERHAGRTLLHEAAAQGNLAMVELLLRLGADVDAKDGGSHTPLYCVANEQRGSGGAEVVRLLARSGADVNANDGAKRCTPLHMAARRGNVEIAEALLDCGAELDACDRLGVTPLVRAVNCGKLQVAALLIEHAATGIGENQEMAARICYHCKQPVHEGEAHDCWTTTEAALTKGLTEDLRDAWERVRETAASFGDQRIYASHKSIMFSRKACYFFVRPKKNALELCVFLGREVDAPQVRRRDRSSRSKFYHLIDIKHRDEVEPPLTDWLQEAYEFSAAPAASRQPPQSRATLRDRPGSRKAR